MKIAQVAPLYESVPPTYYGGTERVVSYITEELIRQGHDVTLFASGDSQTMARLWAACPHSFRLESGLVNRDAPLLLMQEQALGVEAQSFDVVHSHLDFLSFPLSRRCATPAYAMQNRSGCNSGLALLKLGNRSRKQCTISVAVSPWW